MSLFRRLIVGLVSIYMSLYASQSLDWKDPKWDWMDEQIEAHFFPVRETGITKEMIRATMDYRPRLSFSHHLHHYKIIKGQVYGDSCPDYHPKELLEKILQLYPVPDVEIFLFDQDIIWNPWELRSPAFVTCKHYGGHNILFPVEVWEGWEVMAQETETASSQSPWEGKIEKLCWRGGAHLNGDLKNPDSWTQFERGRVCILSNQRPDLIDAAFSRTLYWMFTSDAQKEEFMKLFPFRSLSWEEYINHKYLIDLDGYVASTPGLAWKLLSNCTVLKRDSNYTIWFSNQLKPWVHYVPWDGSDEDLIAKTYWMKEHDDQAKAIAENGREFAKNNILPEHAYLYCYKVLLKYASLQRFTPSLDD